MREWLSVGNLMFRSEEVILVKLSVADGQHPHRFIVSEPGDVDIDHHIGI